MRVLVINPNSTTAMTGHVAMRLGLRLEPGMEILQSTASQGASVIATQQAFDAGAQLACELLRQAIDERRAFDKVLLACFGDPGLEPMRLITPAPIVGLAFASMQVAENLRKPYAVVTAGAAWEAILVQRFRQWGASDLFCGVQVTGGTGLDIFNDPVAAMPAVHSAVAAARLAGAENIILGGAVFAGYKALMTQHGIDTRGLLDCVECAAETLLR